jgi:hypothetical protein
MINMLLNMQMIADHLERLNPILLLSEDETPCLENVKLKKTAQTVFESRYVYVVCPEDILGGFSCEGQASFICVGELAERPDGLPQFCAVILPSAHELASVFDEAQEAFEFYDRYENELKESLINSKGLQDLVDIGFRMFKNPMYIINTAFMTMAWSKEVSSDSIDTLWKSISEEGHVNLDLMNYLKNTMMVDFLNRQRSGIFFKIDSIDYQSVICNIWVRGNRVGRLVVLGALTPLSKKHIYLAEHLTKYVTAAIEKDEHYISTGGTLYEYFIIDQIAGKKYDGRVIEYHLRSLGWKTDDPYHILFVDMSSSDVINTTLEYYSILLKNMFFDSRCVIYEKNIFLIINSSKHTDPFDSFLKPLRQFLSKNGLKAGLSMVFNDFSKLCDYRRQASAAVELGEAMNAAEHLFCYEEYAVFHMIDTCSKEYNIMSFCSPKALLVHEYDKKNNTDLLHTLYMYILKDKSLINSAKELRIHRNSLVYRLKRITDLFDIQLENENEQLHLIMSYKIIDYVESTNK